MKKSSDLGTTSDLVGVHTLIFSLWGATLIGLRKQTKLELSFVSDQHLFWNSGSFNFLENTYSNAFDCIELCSQRVIHLFEAMKLSSYSLKLKLVSPNVEEILAGGELKCLQRPLIVGQQSSIASTFSCTLANGHIMLNTPVLVRSLKLSNIEPSQYLDG